MKGWTREWLEKASTENGAPAAQTVTVRVDGRVVDRRSLTDDLALAHARLRGRGARCGQQPALRRAAGQPGVADGRRQPPRRPAAGRPLNDAPHAARRRGDSPVPTENLIRTVRVTDRADVGPACSKPRRGSGWGKEAKICQRSSLSSGHATCVSDLGNLRFELRGKLAVKLGAGMATRRPRRSTSRRASRPRQRFLIEGRQCPIATTDPRCSSPVRSSTRRSGPTA